MTDITFNINKLRELELTPNEFTLLTLIYRGLDYKEVKSSIDISKLINLGYIKLHPETLEITLLTKFKSKIEAFESRFRVDSWINEWYDLWPKGVKTMGKPVRGGLDKCIKKMSAFILKNPTVTKEQIMETTRAYVLERSKDQYRGISCCYYFIEKDGISALGDYIDMLSHREKEYKSFEKRGI